MFILSLSTVASLYGGNVTVNGTAEMAQMSPLPALLATAALDSFSATMATVPIRTFSVTTTRTVLTARMKMLCFVVGGLTSYLDKLFTHHPEPVFICYCLVVTVCSSQLRTSVKAISGSVRISGAFLSLGSATARMTAVMSPTRTLSTAPPGPVAQDSSSAATDAASHRAGNAILMMIAGTVQTSHWRSAVSSLQEFT